jgi:hypothetical protein
MTRRNLLPATAILLTWAILYLPRPFLLGFYSDDWHVNVLWSTLDEPLRRLSFQTLFLERPMPGIVLYAYGALFGDAAWPHHIVMTLWVLAAAAALYAMLRRVFFLLEFPDPALAAALGACCWLAMPWTHGITAWPIINPTLGAQICMSLATLLILTSNPSWRTAAGAGALTFAGNLFYEAFYFQALAFLPVILVWTYPRLRWFAIYAGTLLATTALNFALNRVYAFYGLGNYRRLNPDWLFTIQNHPGRLSKIIESMPETYVAVGFVASILVLGFLVGAAFFIWQRRRRGALSLIAFLGTLAFGYVGGHTVLAFAGIEPWFLGIDSRSTFTLSFWTAFALAGMFALSVPRVAARTAGVVLIVLLGWSNVQRTLEWSEASRRQQKVLDEFPIERFATLPSNATVVYFTDSYFHQVPIWAAFYDLASAVQARLAAQRNARGQLHPMAALWPAIADMATGWDGQKLVYGLDDCILFRSQMTRESPEVWFYEAESVRLVRAEGPFWIRGGKVQYDTRVPPSPAPCP